MRDDDIIHDVIVYMRTQTGSRRFASARKNHSDDVIGRSRALRMGGGGVVRNWGPSRTQTLRTAVVIILLINYAPPLSLKLKKNKLNNKTDPTFVS